VIPSPRVELYTAPFCALCERARQLLGRAGIACEEIDRSSDPERCSELETLTGGHSVPQLLIDGRPIGGFDELAALDRAGRLREWPSAEWIATTSADR